jgi:hypothetical protein
MEAGLPRVTGRESCHIGSSLSERARIPAVTFSAGLVTFFAHPSPSLHTGDHQAARRLSLSMSTVVIQKYNDISSGAKTGSPWEVCLQPGNLCG